MIIMASALGLFLLVIGAVKFFQIRAAMGASWTPQPEAVTTAVADQAKWPATLHAVGTVAAVHGVVVSADLPGLVASINFDSGRNVRQGQVLVRLDTKQEQAQLAAAEAQRDLSRLNVDRASALLKREVIAQAEYDRLAAEAKQTEAQVNEIRATIQRKQIRAPFSGALGIRQVNLGQYLEGGAPIVPLQSMDPVYVNFSLPQQDVSVLKIGANVRVSSDSTAAKDTFGKITAINSVVDEATRNVQVQATFRNPHARLRPGMYVEVEAGAGASANVVAIPTSAINYAPYGNSVFVVTDMKDPKGKPYRGVEQRFVQLGGERGDQVAVTTGLKKGDEVVSSGVFKLRNGASVKVNNQIQPGNNPAPKPEDN
jgi:membrane fusion protein (multidrug efflux system)